MINVFVKMKRGELVGDKWRFPGSIVKVPEDLANRLIALEWASPASGPEKDGSPDDDDLAATGIETAALDVQTGAESRGASARRRGRSSEAPAPPSGAQGSPASPPSS